jgi:hypothetical protein
VTILFPYWHEEVEIYGRKFGCFDVYLPDEEEKGITHFVENANLTGHALPLQFASYN